jgi:hypothetical protein
MQQLLMLLLLLLDYELLLVCIPAILRGADTGNSSATNFRRVFAAAGNQYSCS